MGLYRSMISREQEELEVESNSGSRELKEWEVDNLKSRELKESEGRQL